MTAAERKLWSILRSAQLDGNSFRKQAPIGPYVLDFSCPALRLAVEVDGGQHNEAKGIKKDNRRSRWLRDHHITVCRFWNNDVLNNLDGVASELLRVIKSLHDEGMTPSLVLPLSGGGELGAGQ